MACVLLLSMLTACVQQPAGTNGSDGGVTDTTVAPPKPTDPVPPTTVPNPTNPDEDGYRVSLEEGKGADIECSTNLNQPIKAGTTISFTLKISAFYEGTPVVRAGEEALTPNENGLYSFTVKEDTVITIEGLTVKTSTMSGTGTSDDPYLITTPVDMLFIAEQVNAGLSAYTNAHYSLQKDLDFEGEQMTVIGDGSTDYSVFCGYFMGNGHTISNYYIKAGNTQYVGLFGVLQADMSGTVTGGGSIYDLHLKDFTIEASAPGKACFVGAMAGYGMGGNLFLCSAENGTINVYADGNSFSYVGGMMGIQQALDNSGYAYYSSISYCYTDVDINCNSGMVYAAGGISGYVAASSDGVTSYINNCYALGDVYGSMRAGGLAGYLSSGTSVVNSYATGVVSAQTTATDKVNSVEFCYAYAGGLVGYAEANSVIAECFSTSVVQAVASLGGAYQVTNGTLAFTAPVEKYDFGNQPATVFNCIYAKDGKDDQIDLTNGAFIQEKLHWNNVDWVFEDGKYPTFNLENDEESQNYSFTVTINIDGEDNAYEGMTYLMPMHFWYRLTDEMGNLIGLPTRLQAANSNRISYGYYFDEAHTQPVPDGFIPSYNITLYAATADVSDVIGDYDLVVEGIDEPIRLTLKADGTFLYTDAGKTAMSGYIYNGKTIIFEDARFAQYVSGGTDLTHYQFYTFCATVQEDGSLKIIGGVYDDGVSTEDTIFFTEEKPLMAIPLKTALSGSYFDGTGIYIFNADGTGFHQTASGLEVISYTRSGAELTIYIGNDSFVGSVSDGNIIIAGKTLRQLDIFAGSWNVDSKANKVYTFDGAGNWTYLHYGYISGNKTVYERAAGTYTIDDSGILTLAGDYNGTAELNSGVLYVTVNGKTVTCHQDGGFYGTWIYPDYGMTLVLKGINANGQGIARVEYLYADGVIEFYDMIYALDGKDPDRICLYYRADTNGDGIPDGNYEAFGYLNYRPESDRLYATIYVGPMGTFMSNVNLIPVDNYVGEWIGQIAGLPVLKFDGNGKLTIGQQELTYTLENGTLYGSFYYNGTVYQIAYNEHDDTMTILYNDQEATYYRKDAFGDLTLTDGNHTYTFDGRGGLDSLGTMYIDGDAAYTYQIVGKELRILSNGRQVGSITVGETAYLLELNGQELVELRIHTAFTDFWARSEFPAGMVIGSMGLDGKLYGKIDTTDVVFTMEEDGSLSFVLGGETIYLVLVGEQNMIMSPYREWYLYTNYVYAYCARVDEMYGSWKNGFNVGYQFDGSSNGTLTAAIVRGGSFSSNGTFNSTTAYGYRYENGQWIMWNVDSATGLSKIYRLNFVDVAKASKQTYINADGTLAFNLEEGDRLYNLEATDSNGVTYSFDGFGKVTTSEGKTYTYKNVVIHDATYTATANIVIDDVTYQATIDYSSEDVSIVLEQK